MNIITDYKQITKRLEGKYIELNTFPNTKTKGIIHNIINENSYKVLNINLSTCVKDFIIHKNCKFEIIIIDKNKISN